MDIYRHLMGSLKSYGYQCRKMHRTQDIHWRPWLWILQRGQLLKRKNSIYIGLGGRHLSGARGNNLLEICTPDIRISNISAGYHSYNQRISRENWPYFNWISNRFQQILKNICWIYVNISQISVDSGQGVKNSKNRSKQPCFDRRAGYQPDTIRISRPFVHLISWVVIPWSGAIEQRGTRLLTSAVYVTYFYIRFK